MGFDLVDQLGFVAAFGQEHPDQLDDLITGKHQARIAAARVELGQLLAQQRQQQAHRKRQWTPRHQARKLWRCVIFGFRARAQEGIALGLVKHQLQAQHRHIVAHAGLQVEQGIPKAGVSFLIDHAFEQSDDQGRQIIRCRRDVFKFLFCHPHLTKITRGKRACFACSWPSVPHGARRLPRSLLHPPRS